MKFKIIIEDESLVPLLSNTCKTLEIQTTSYNEALKFLNEHGLKSD